MMHLLAVWAALALASEGTHVVANEHSLRGTDSLGGMRLYLVTLNRERRDDIDVQPDIHDGPLVLPTRAHDYSFLVALTQAEQELLERNRDDKWSDHPTTPSRSRLRSFFARTTFVRSEPLALETVTSDPDESGPRRITWTLVGVDGLSLVMTPNEVLPSAPLKGAVLFAAVGLGVLIVLMGVFLRRRLRRHS